MTLKNTLARWAGPLIGVWKSGIAGRCLLAASVLLIPGLLCPILTLDTLGSDPARYSVLAGIGRLFGSGKVLLGAVVLGFSVIFPVAKLFLLLRYCVKQSLPFAGSWLLLLGKWSMLDVFVVAVIIGAGRLKLLSNFDSEVGVYWFGAAVALSMVGAELLLGASGRVQVQHYQRGWQDWLRGGRCIVAAGLLIAGLSFPLMEVSKWLFWENQYSVLSAIPGMRREGEWLLPLVLIVTVCLAPVLKLLFSAAYSVFGLRSMFHFSEVANRWSMLSVFVLSLLLVMLKLGDSTRVSAQPGFWLLLTATVLNLMDSRRTFVLAKRAAKEALPQPEPEP